MKPPVEKRTAPGATGTLLSYLGMLVNVMR